MTCHAGVSLYCTAGRFPKASAAVASGQHNLASTTCRSSPSAADPVQPSHNVIFVILVRKSITATTADRLVRVSASPPLIVHGKTVDLQQAQEGRRCHLTKDCCDQRWFSQLTGGIKTPPFVIRWQAAGPLRPEERRCGRRCAAAAHGRQVARIRTQLVRAPPRQPPPQRRQQACKWLHTHGIHEQPGEVHTSTC